MIGSPRLKKKKNNNPTNPQTNPTFHFKVPQQSSVLTIDLERLFVWLSVVTPPVFKGQLFGDFHVQTEARAGTHAAFQLPKSLTCVPRMETQVRYAGHTPDPGACSAHTGSSPSFFLSFPFFFKYSSNELLLPVF